MIEEIKAFGNLVKSKIRKPKLTKKFFIIPIVMLLFSSITLAFLIPLSSAGTLCAWSSGLTGILTNLLITGASLPSVPPIVCTICTILLDAEFIILVLSLGLLALGGVLYASAHLLPGQQRGGLIGYGFGMIIGGIVGLIFVLAAPYIVNQVLTSANFSLPSLLGFGGIFGNSLGAAINAIFGNSTSNIQAICAALTL